MNQKNETEMRTADVIDPFLWPIDAWHIRCFQIVFSKWILFRHGFSNISETFETLVGALVFFSMTVMEDSDDSKGPTLIQN